MIEVHKSQRLRACERKLQELGYEDNLDESSLPLAEKMLEELVQTTNSYRALKMRCSKQQNELEAWQSKVAPPTRPRRPPLAHLRLRLRAPDRAIPPDRRPRRPRFLRLAPRAPDRDQDPTPLAAPRRLSP